MRAEPLSPEEWKHLQDVLIDVFTESLPDPQITKILAVKEEDEIVGFVMMESIVHVKHIWVRPDRVAKGVADELARATHELLIHRRSAVLVATSKAAERLARLVGMTKKDGVAYVKESIR